MQPDGYSLPLTKLSLPTVSFCWWTALCRPPSHLCVATTLSELPPPRTSADLNFLPNMPLKLSLHFNIDHLFWTPASHGRYVPRAIKNNQDTQCSFWAWFASCGSHWEAFHWLHCPLEQSSVSAMWKFLPRFITMHYFALMRVLVGKSKLHQSKLRYKG